MNSFFKFDNRIIKAAKQAMSLCKEEIEKIEEIKEYNQNKMLYAFQKAQTSESHLLASTGYGYGDRGRDVLDEIYATVFDAEDALVRYNFVSGTHTLEVALFGVLRPGDKMLSVTGTPYDTIHPVIGINGEGDGNGNLKDFGVEYDEVPLTADETPDYEAIERAIDTSVKMVYIQRSRGYSTRPSLTCEEIAKIAGIAKRKAPAAIVMLDNCYGEFVEVNQPLSNGVDLMAGSLIKNPGGGIAPTGGYIAGRRNLVELCACRLTTPATGKEIGATLGHNRELFMGAYNAPIASCEALKTAVFAAALFEVLGYEVSPRYNEQRGDIIQVIKLKSPEALVAFCKGIQQGAPIDSFVVPEPWDMPGYNCKVIMAAGAFTLGSSIELSADAPLREPYACWMQGGINFPAGKTGVMLAAQSMLNEGIL
ncbi:MULTISPECIES: methionine gamma-lyase family protein [unclassified Ruminococcus]|uniref:methionine gamma-lyase family protein n=1 Tax=unclassified Ruminococcus TaxID=2608920 RepID=UPI002109A21E|nr:MULTISPECIES: methionine gamma-lyase family protein [unclassified Ruminococcus]MCQ4022047.1 hypothetical protein [Ruminococcus sp. zg-924]MCQ4114367.1 hypothetical protein [Ruminococcus sp. zg-921]